jgi:hypothetical protein
LYCVPNPQIDHRPALDIIAGGDEGQWRFSARHVAEITRIALKNVREATQPEIPQAKLLKRLSKPILDFGLLKGLWSAEFRESGSCRREKREALIRPH